MLPKLHLFNPTSDTALASGDINYRANAILQQFESDLAYLPAFFSILDDVILAEQAEPPSHIDLFSKLGFPTPNTITKKAFIAQTKAYEFSPWGWAPNLQQIWKSDSIADQLNIPNAYRIIWSNETKLFYSRLTALKVLESILDRTALDCFIGAHQIPKALTNLQQVEMELLRLGRMVLKEPWSSSGRGLLMLHQATLIPHQTLRIEQILAKQGFIMAEHFFDKRLDFSMHFESDHQKIWFKGLSFFETKPNGQYQAQYLNGQKMVQSDALEYLLKYQNMIVQELVQAMEQQGIQSHYSGVFGVDMMVIKEEHTFKINPMVEINFRKSMGTVALAIEKKIHPEAKGYMHLVVQNKQKFEWVYQSHAQKAEFCDGLIIKGTVPLVAPQGRAFGAYIELV